MNIAFVWDDTRSRGDWQITNGRTTTGSLLVAAVYISLFTDRVQAPDAAGDPKGWWDDTFLGVPIGSRLYQLRRRKIDNRQQLINEATDILTEALQWMIDTGVAASVHILVTSVAASAAAASSGNLLRFRVTIVQPNAPPTLVSAIWSAV